MRGEAAGSDRDRGWAPLPIGLGILLALVSLGCGPGAGGRGELQVFVEAEDSIPEGLQPGDEAENIQDGWAVSYQRFLLTVGNFRASRSVDLAERLIEPRAYVVDLLNSPPGGVVVARFPGVAATRWDRVGFDLPQARPGTLAAEGTSDSAHSLMTANGYSIYFEATLAKSDGSSCLPSAPADCVPTSEVKLRWGLTAGTSFDDCAPPMGDAGFAVPSGGTVQVKPTIHGDHWFFTNLTQGAEITERRAQWIVDSDLDRDGETTLDELRQVMASDVFPSPRYNLTGALVPIDTAFDYLEAQVRSIGDFQGEGECPTRRILP